MDISKQEYLSLLFDCEFRLNQVRIKDANDFIEYLDIYATILGMRDNLRLDIEEYLLNDELSEAKQLMELYMSSKHKGVNMSYKLNRLITNRFPEFRNIVYGEV